MSEILKTEANFFKNWNIFFWRTKEKEEIDFIIEDHEKIMLIEVKLISSSQYKIKIPKTIEETKKEIILVVVSSVGETIQNAENNFIVPIKNLAMFLNKYLK